MKEFWHEIINGIETYESNLISDIQTINAINPYSKRELNRYPNLYYLTCAKELAQPQPNNPHELSQLEYSIYESDYILEYFREIIKKSTWSFSNSWQLPAIAFPTTPEIYVIPVSNNFIFYFTKMFIYAYETTRNVHISGHEISFAYVDSKNQIAHEKQSPYFIYDKSILLTIKNLSAHENVKFYLNIINLTDVLTKTVNAIFTKNKPIEDIIYNSSIILKQHEKIKYLATKNHVKTKLEKLSQPIA